MAVATSGSTIGGPALTKPVSSEVSLQPRNPLSVKGLRLVVLHVMDARQTDCQPDNLQFLLFASLSF
jgi:hypothetical protein